ncbi:hypothetical protein QR680_005537 [Steinernema hermaphroditum]|uniref:Ras-GEF domain-containing protein n=1 Tax=Steinernema hermaphroditum TaxID=289476 RepID=A0AA39HUK5_9BILA|nr:hypothetical protein QR680_005537 [Steinernema hermaphroditum]
MTASVNVENGVGGHPSTPMAATRRQMPTAKRNIFVERICVLNAKANPGMPIESAAQAHIQTILLEILYSLIDAQPTGIADMERCMQTALPSTTYHWILKNYSRNAHSTAPKPKGSSSDRKNAKLLQEDVSSLFKEYTGQKPDQKIVHEFISIVECIATDILQWTGKYVKNIPHGQHGIELQNLKIALSADKSLIDLTEMLKNDEEEASPSVLEAPPIIEESVEVDYEKISKDMLREDSLHLQSMSLLVNVFKRKLEIRVAKLEPRDPKQYVERVFGSIEEIYEISLRLHRFLQDAVEMSEIHCVGSSGLWELCEAKEFNCYLDYAKQFQGLASILTPIREMLADPLYTDFFRQEDRAYGLSGCQTFQLAMKYILPKLLEEPLLYIVRFTNHFLLNLIPLTRSEDDRVELRNSCSYLKQVISEMGKVCKGLEAPIYTNRGGWIDSHRSPQELLQNIQRSIEGWQGREILHKCSRLVKEGILEKGRQPNHMSKASRTERYVFLFDSLLVLCKPKKSSDRSPVYKFKSKFEVRKTDIFEVPETEGQHAFRIVATSSPNGDYQESTEIVLFCRSAEEKFAWLSAIVDIHTRSLLDRRLEAYIKEEESRIPLEIPGPEQYRFAEPDTDEHIIFEDYTSNSGIPVVKHATILKLVERLTYPLYLDAKFVQMFLTTYRSFCQPEQLLQLLMERFNVPTPRALEAIDNCLPCSPAGRSQVSAFSGGPLAGRFDTVQSHGLPVGRVSNARLEQSYQRFRMEFQQPIQKRVISVCDQWLRRHFYDFENNPQLVDDMVRFLTEARLKTGNSERWKFQKILDKIRASQNEFENELHEVFVDFSDAELTLPRRTPSIQSQSGGSARPPILWHTVAQNDVANYDLLSLHPIEIGRQLTLLHFDLYRVVKPIELVDCAWMKADKLKRSPRLMQYMDKTNQLIYWVAKSIVETESLEERVALVSRVLEIMFIFEELHNFNGIIAFNSALGSSAVARLKATFERLDKEKQKWLVKFKKLCDSHGKEMAKRLSEVAPPVIPFIGTYLSRFCFFDESRKTIAMRNVQTNEENEQGCDSTQMIEFGTCRKTAKLIEEIQMYQNEPYQFQVEISMRYPTRQNGHSSRREPSAALPAELPLRCLLEKTPHGALDPPLEEDRPMSDIFDCVQLPTPSTSFQRHCTRAAAGPPPRYENFRPPAECSANFSSGLSNYLAHCGESSAILEASASLESVADAEEESSPRHRVVQKAASSDCALPTRRSKQSRNVLLRKWKRLRGARKIAADGAVLVDARRRKWPSPPRCLLWTCRASVPPVAVFPPCNLVLFFSPRVSPFPPQMLSCQLCCCCAQSPPTTPSAVANHPQFFESINPLEGFEDNNALEEYLYNQSKKIEPGKEDSKWDFQKPRRSAQTLKSPGVKVPKWQQTTSLANGAPSSPNVYHRSNPLCLDKPLAPEDRSRSVTLSTSTISSPVEESPFGLIDIHPGHHPVYIRDAKSGTLAGQRPSLPLRRSIPPPSPSLKSEAPREMAPPPLHPRRISPPKTDDSPAASAQQFVFPPPMPSPSSSEGSASPPMPAAVPPVPPRKGANRASVGLPAPLSVDSVSKHFWRGEQSPTSPTVSLSVPLPAESSRTPPPELPPRQRAVDLAPPPRPPKKNHGKLLAVAPPLPPKTYKNRVQNN